MSDNRKPKKVTIDPDNMTRLAVAWLAFLDDCKAAEDKEKAAFQAEINTVKLRAKAIGASMTDYGDDPTYGTFTLAWPMGHALERFNHHWTYGNHNISLVDVQDRLKHVEKHVAKAQNEACTEKSISTPERQFERAVAVGGYLTADSDEHNEHTRYWLNFMEGHPFHGFWHQYDDLTAGQVEYRLRYVEGVMQQQALQK